MQAYPRDRQRKERRYPQMLSSFLGDELHRHLAAGILYKV